MRYRLLALPLLVTAACGGGGTGDPGGERECVPGTVNACVCGDGKGEGSAACDDQGRPGACACPGTVTWLPRSLDFGEVEPGTAREASIALSNDGGLPVPLRSVTLSPESDSHLVLVAAPTEIPAGAAALVVVSFRSELPVVASGTVRIEVEGLARPIEVPLSAKAVGPALDCTPTSLAFTGGVVGTLGRLPVNCRNASVSGNLFDGVIRYPRVESDHPEFFGEPDPPAMLLGLEEQVTFAIGYLPLDGELTDRATLRLVAEGVSVEVQVTGESHLATCALEVPEAVSLAGVPTEELAGAVTIRNPRVDAGCRVGRIELGEGCPAELSIELPPAPTTILAGGELVLPVSLAAGTEQVHHACTLSVHTEGPEPRTYSTRVEIDRSWRPCLVVEGPTEFPAVSPSCGPTATGAVLANRCNRDFLLGGLAFTADSAPGFTVIDPPPPAIPAGGRWPLPIAFDPEVGEGESGPVAATLEVVSPLDSTPWRFPFTSVRLDDDLVETLSFQRSGGPLDVLVVIDNGLGMFPEAVRIAAELGPMPDKLYGYDYRLAVTTTGVAPAATGICPGGAGGGENGRFVPVDGSRPRVISPSTPDGRAAWEANLQVGACHDAPAQPFAAAIRALGDLARVYDDPTSYSVPDDGNAGLFPAGSRPLLLVFVGDRDDASPEMPAEAWNALQAARNWKRIDVVAIAGAPGTGCTGARGEVAAPGDRLAALATLAQGTTASICDGPWTFLDAYDIDWALRVCFPVEGVPVDGNGDGMLDDVNLVVRVGGQTVPPVADDGSLNWLWMTDVDGQGVVCFDGAARPPPGTAVLVGTLSCGGEE